MSKYVVSLDGVESVVDEAIDESDAIAQARAKVGNQHVKSQVAILCDLVPVDAIEPPADPTPPIEPPADPIQPEPPVVTPSTIDPAPPV